jgi:tetratricopeptide (TPR) repeat protein
MYDNKFDQADREFRRAIEVNPSYATGHHWYSVCLMTFGRRKESLEQVLIAEELDPLSPAITMSAIYRLMGFGMNEEVEKRIQKLKEVDPQSPLVTEALMVYSLVRREWKDATIYLTKMIEQDPADPYLDMDLAYLYTMTGRREQAMMLVEKLKKSVPDSARIKGQLLAFVYTGLNDLDQAFAWLNYAFEHKEVFIYWIRGHPHFEAVRRDPRFVELLKRAGLPLDDQGHTL